LWQRWWQHFAEFEKGAFGMAWRVYALSDMVPADALFQEPEHESKTDALIAACRIRYAPRLRRLSHIEGPDNFRIEAGDIEEWCTENKQKWQTEADDAKRGG
jgi:hypothetical protein